VRRPLPLVRFFVPDERTSLATAEQSYDIADIGLAEAGQKRIDWAERRMPVLRQIRERFERERPLDGIRMACCLHVTTETANLVRTLLAGGADVALCASNPLSTQDETAAALVDRYGAQVFAINGEDNDTYYRHISAAVERRPQITMDDGADVVGVLHGERTDLLDGVLGGTEETTTGVIRLKALEREGKLGYPIIAVNDAATKHFFDNRYGTGQSTLDGVIRATNLLIAGSRVVVIGYGWCGKGVAMRAKGHGAHVIVCEVDPLRALEAVMDGFDVMPATEAAKVGDVFISVTGDRDAIDRRMFEVMKSGAIIANSGHFDVEINKGDLDAITVETFEARPFVEGHRTGDGREIFLLADGRLVNLAAAEGHPADVMDMSFANQALAAEHMVREAASLERKVYPVPTEIDREIARLKLASKGIEIDSLTEKQEQYLASWDQGT
jgi:adenosylhomocysteinase